jgi:hypothetical protein
MEKWEYCYVLQNPDETGVVLYQDEEEEKNAKKLPDLGVPNGRKVIEELWKDGWETISVSALREGAAGAINYQKKPTYKWVFKRKVSGDDAGAKMAHD